jgi:hypothetical protein
MGNPETNLSQERERKVKKYLTGANGEAVPVYDDENEGDVAERIQRDRAEMK